MRQRGYGGDRSSRGMHRLGRWWGTVIIAVAAAVFVGAPPASAFSVGACGVGNAYHVWGHQWATGNYYGQYGWFTTYNMSVPDPNTAFSLSHLYTYANNTNPGYATTWIEVGYYKGYGPQRVVTTPHYYYAYSYNNTYTEVDSSSGPSTGSSISYQVEFQGHNNTLKTDDWTVYWNGVGTVRGTIHQPSMSSGHALAGGEVQGDASSWTQMQTHGTAKQQIILTSYTWHDWTTYFTSTTACESAGITFKENSNYMDFTANGQA
jgi:hypothetical protein